MNMKLKLAIIVSIPIILIWLWVGIFFSLTKNDTRADIIDDTTNATWKVDLTNNQIKDSPTIDSWTDIIDNTTPKQLTNINLYMPVYLYNYNGWRPIINHLAQKWIVLKIITNIPEQDYYTYLSGVFSTWDNVDIFLIDNFHIKEYQDNIATFWFSQDISALFHYVFFDYIKSNQSFMPFGVDPMVTFSRYPIASNPNKIERDDIINNSMKWLDNTWSDQTIPIFFGLSKYDIALMKDHKESYPWFVDILSNVIYQSKFRWEILDIIKWYSAVELQVKLWDFVQFKKNLSSIDPTCQLLMKLCFMKAWFVNFALWYMSELENFKLIWGSDYNMYNFPTNTNSYPVRLRGFSINKANYDKIIRSGIASSFFQEYLDQAAQWNIYLRPSIYSSFNNIIQKQKDNLQTSYLSYFVNERSVNPIDLKDKQTYDQMAEVVEWKRDIKEFVSTAELLK